MSEFPEPIRSAQNRQIQQLRKWLAHPAQLRRDGVFLADGFHLVGEALARDYPPQNLFIDADGERPELAQLVGMALDRGVPVTGVVSRLFASLSPVESPQGIIGVFSRVPSPPIPLQGTIVVADGIQDPGNLGSICRSARAAGAVGLAALPGTADIFHPRVLRAAMGSSFGWPTQAIPGIAELKSDSSPRTWIALSNHAEESLTDLDPAADYALVLGSEGSGLREETAVHLDRQIRIPMSRDVESLGVAAAAAVALFWLQLSRPSQMQ